MYNLSKKINSNNAVNRIKNWDYNNLTTEDDKYLHFKFPNRMNFVSSSFREMEFKDIPINVLIDAYIKKAKLDSSIRAGIATTMLYKLVSEQNFSGVDIEEAKLELLSDIEPATDDETEEDIEPATDDDATPKAYTVEEVFYIIKIQLGSQNILKYGRTKNMNQRLRQYKSNIKSFDGYSTRSLSIKVLHIQPTKQAEAIEKEVKGLLKKSRIKQSGFYFGGYTETLEYKNYNKFMMLINPIILNHK